jgi:hypothetical protein
MKFRETLVLLMLAVCAFVPTISAADYSAEESVIESMLLDPEMNVPIKSVDASISTEQVVFDCITDISIQETGAPLGQVSMFVGGVLGAYYLILSSAPEVGDLVILWKNQGDRTTGKMTCLKSWINSVDFTNENEINGLIYKVIGTSASA